MDTNYRKHKIKEADTLLSIARENNLKVKDVIEYHNKRVNSYDSIHKELPEFLKEVILPIEGYGIVNGDPVWLDKNKKEPRNALKKSFSGKIHLENSNRDITYGVLKTIVSGEKENTIKYKVNLRHYNDQDLNKYISIDLVSKIFINDVEPNLIADELAVSCIEIMYPIVLEIDDNLILKDIVNHSDIIKRWEKFKNKKSDYYQGETAQRYFTLFEESIQTKDLFFDLLQNDWFYKIYFNNIYSVYDNDSELNFLNTYFPIIANTKSVQYTIAKKATEINKYGRLKVEFEGECSDVRNKLELEEKSYFPASIERQSEIVKGTYRAVYFLSETYHEIESAHLTCDLELNEHKSGSITISEIKDDSDINKPRHSENIDGQDESEKDKKKKKTFWKSLFS